MMLLKPEKPGDEEGPRTRLTLTVLIVATIAILIPFVTRAFNMDDPLFLWIARQIQREPLNPFGFDVIWYWTEEPMHMIMKNPPLVSYFIAIVTAVVGWSEPALHAAFLLPAIALVTGTYLLARHFCSHPALAAFVTLLTPVVLVSSTTLMSDVTMLGFWVFGLYFWIRGLEKQSNLWLFIATGFVCASMLSKYFGISLILLILVYTVAKYRRFIPALLFLLLPVSALAAYHWGTEAMYGRGLVADAAAYATDTRPAGSTFLEKSVIAFTFTGGCTITMMLFGYLLWNRRLAMIGLVMVPVVAIAASSLQSSGGYALPTESSVYWLRAAQIGLFAVGGVALLSIALMDVFRKRDAETLLLALWVVGTFVFAGFVNWSTNARSILPMVPPAAMLLTRRLVERMGNRDFGNPRRLLVPLVLAALVSFAVCWADFNYANSAREGASQVVNKVRGISGTIWFQGHWGFQYYMERAGARPIDTKRTSFNPGDVVTQPLNNTNLFPMKYEWAKYRESVSIPYSSFLSTMSFQMAGFYADEHGPLPFAFGPVAPEQYHIFDVR